jgi:hypothetical protein
MNKLIRSKLTKAFLTEGGDWTLDFRRAHIFITSEAALVAVFRQELRDVEIYYLCGQEPSDRDFTISLGSSEVNGLGPAHQPLPEAGRGRLR